LRFLPDHGLARTTSPRLAREQLFETSAQFIGRGQGVEGQICDRTLQAWVRTDLVLGYRWTFGVLPFCALIGLYET
jgi:hypothetical protein